MYLVNHDYLSELIKDIENDKKNLKRHFSNSDDLIFALKELQIVIGMKKLKNQVVQQIKTYIASKIKNIYNEKDRKHCLLCGPPGCGKTTVGKILCKIWVAIGFLGDRRKTNSKVTSFNKLQDEIIRKQRTEIREYKDKLRGSLQCLNSLGRITTICKRNMNTVLTLKKNTANPPPSYDEIMKDTAGMMRIVEDNIKKAENLNRPVDSNFKGMGIEGDSKLQKTKNEGDVPFYVYNKNDVVSRYVGDTAHMCTKAMTDALYGVAYFDEATISVMIIMEWVINTVKKH